MQHITYALVRKTINILVFIAMVVTFLPFTGFGAYVDETSPTNPKCLRYRDAEGFWNKTYSVLFMSFGEFMVFDLLRKHNFKFCLNPIMKFEV